MEHLYLSFSIVFPLFFYMLLGFYIRRSGMLSIDILRSLNKVVFQIFIPLMLFINVYQSDFTASLNPRLFLLANGGILLVFALLCVVIPRLFPDKKTAPVIIQGIYRSNYVLFGITIAANLYPDQELGIVSSLAAFSVPLFNILSVVLFETYRGQKVEPLRLVRSILRNPLVMAGLLGVLFVFLPFRIPLLLEKSMADAAKLASPLALICLGGMLSIGSMRRHAKELTLVVLGRLFIVPAIALTVFIWLGYRNMELTAILALFASPTAVASHPMAHAMGGNGDLAGEIVASTSILCIISLFLLIWFMKAQGYIL